MRFLFVDQILEAEPGNRLLASKTIGNMDEYLASHYPRRPLVPPTLVIECLAQAGGWLNLISRDFGVKTVLGLIEGVRVHRDVRPGEVLSLEVWLEYAHQDGATVRAEARVGRESVMTVERLMFVHQWTTDAEFSRLQRERFANLTGLLRA